MAIIKQQVFHVPSNAHLDPGHFFHRPIERQNIDSKRRKRGDIHRQGSASVLDHTELFAHEGNHAERRGLAKSETWGWILRNQSAGQTTHLVRGDDAVHVRWRSFLRLLAAPRYISTFCKRCLIITFTAAILVIPVQDAVNIVTHLTETTAVHNSRPGGSIRIPEFVQGNPTGASTSSSNNANGLENSTLNSSENASLSAFPTPQMYNANYIARPSGIPQSCVKANLCHLVIESRSFEKLVFGTAIRHIGQLQPQLSGFAGFGVE